MNSFDNMLLTDTNLNSAIQNHSVVGLDEMFKKHGWCAVKNEPKWINYTKFGDETSCVDIKIDTDKISVSVPIKNSAYQFVTTFKEYNDACKYIEDKFFDYIQL